jgi:4,5:9,10-diseco-3-hydroxy-5,9,17-trioxoandrosta-1(10),2-diene-4-oate hydrolase
VTTTKQDVQAFAQVKTEAAGEISLAYYEADTRAEDKAERLPLVMLHGGGPGASSWSNFGPALPGFAEEFRTLLVDQPGFGASDKPPVVGNYYRFSADAVVALLDRLGIERVHLLGNSLGGGTAMRLALSYPDRVGRLIMMGPGGLSLNLFHASPTPPPRGPRTPCGRWACPSGTPRPPRTACCGARRTGCASTPCSPGVARTGSTPSTARWWPSS